jgi:hypothetical protein
MPNRNPTCGGRPLLDVMTSDQTFAPRHEMWAVTLRGRLNTVTGSFGHGLTLSYDSQGRPSARWRIAQGLDMDSMRTASISLDPTTFVG